MNSITKTIEAIGQQQREACWAERQEAARLQQEQIVRDRAERDRNIRIAQLKAALYGIPNRKKAAETFAADADELAEILGREVNRLANEYATKINAERQQGRGVKLELGSAGANAFFFGIQIMEGLKQLSRIATARNPTAPLLDPESLVAELDAEAQRLTAELRAIEGA